MADQADNDRTLRIVIATFADPDRAPRALATLSPALDGGVGMAAVVVRAPDGKVRFVETHDQTAIQGAARGFSWGAIGGLLGIALGPVALLGVPLGAGIGALIGKLRDTGYDDEELRALGDDLAPGAAALIVTVAGDDVARATRLLNNELDATRVLVKEMDAVLADVLDEIAQPLPPPMPGTAVEG